MWTRAGCIITMPAISTVRFLAWEDWCAPPPDHLPPHLSKPGYWGVLQSFDGCTLGEILGSLGLNINKRIVVYADGARSKGREGRIAWMLLYYGARDVAILDGGFAAWVAEGGLVSSQRPFVQPDFFEVSLQSPRRMQMADLRNLYEQGNLPLMIDTRTKKEFEGNCYAYMPRRGTLPAAVLMPYRSIFDSDDTFIGRDQYLQRLPGEVTQAQLKVAVCEVGVRASTVALLHEAYTGEILPVYDGSIMEWAAHLDLPMMNER